MSRFYVGQRVRIKWSVGWPELNGTEGVILRKAVHPGLGGDAEWIVAPDSWGTNIAPRPGDIHGGVGFSPNGRQLEPLTDLGREVMSWADERCVWRPDHMRTPA